MTKIEQASEEIMMRNKLMMELEERRKSRIGRKVDKLRSEEDSDYSRNEIPKHQPEDRPKSKGWFGFCCFR